jgi:LysR family transcriptional regulator, glycine cleavage system transcriptional activator
VSRHLPPLNALRAFEAAGRLGSLTAAAEELHVTHGAISKAVAQLEGWLGVMLFDRPGRKIRLSAAGRLYQEAVGRALDGLDEATRRCTEARRPRTLVVNALPTFAMRWLLPRLPPFHRTHLDIELRLVTSDAPLASPGGDFDVAIRRGPENWPGFQATPFLEEREIPVLSPRLLDRLPLKTAADLANHTLLHAETRPGAWRRWLAAAGVEPLRPAGNQHFDHFYLALQAAVDGLGVVLGPLPVIDDEIEAGRLVAPLAGPAVPARAYCLVVPMARTGDPMVQAFCGFLMEQGAGPPG